MSSAMPLTVKPTFEGTNTATAVRILRTDFGDGYSQRAADGINTIDKNLTLNWVSSETNIQELITHFEERAGYQTFTINDADIAGDVAYKWTCKEWSYEHLTDDTMSMIASLRREYDL